MEFYNFPDKSVTAGDYEEGISSVISSAQVNKTIAAVYLMGGKIGGGRRVEPGFSDLDFIVVYKDGIRPELLPFPPSPSEKSKFIFTHRYISFTESDFKYFHFVYPKEVNSPTLVYGKELVIIDPESELSNDDYKILLSFVVFDFLINKLWPIKRYKDIPRMDVRRVIAELHSLIYTCEVMEKITGRKIGESFLKEIKDFRSSWFSRNQDVNLEALGGLLKNGIALVDGISKSLENFLKENHLSAENELRFENKNLKMNLSPSFSYFLAAYGSFGGTFGKKIKSCLKGRININVISEGARRHARVMDILYKNAVRYGFKMPFSYGFYENQGLIKKLINYFR